MKLPNNTMFSSDVDPRRGRRLRAWLAIPCTLAIVGGSACSHGAASTPAPVASPSPIAETLQAQTPRAQPELDALSTRAEHFYELGMQAQNVGDDAAADEQFDAAVRVFMEADIPTDQEEEFRTAFNDLVNRIYAQQLAELQIPIESVATDLPQDEIPPLSDSEIDMLRARVVDTLPAMPRFTIPVPADHPRVLAAIEHLTTNRRQVVEEGLSRSTRYLPQIREIFDEAGIPAELAWIPLIESLFKPYVRSRASAVGLWQLMAPTARLYGLRVDWYVDERRDPVKSTNAITKFIRDYYREFGDWHLTIAAYNGGKGRVSRALKRSGTTDFWSLTQTSRYLPRETREFVPKILAAILIGHDTDHYGMRFDDVGRFAFDAVTIDSMTDLEVIAEAAGTDLATIQDLNPELLRRTTPNVSSYSVRVPEGSRSRFRTAFAAIPVNERIRVVEHRIGNGETLSKIADDYGTSVAAISDLNGIRNRHTIRAGRTILIPSGQVRAPNTRSTVSRDLVQGAGLTRGEKVVHTVRSGESLWLIANSYGTTIKDLKRWNGLRADRIDKGDKLNVYYRSTGTAPVAAAAASPVPASKRTASGKIPATALAASEPFEYTIQRGDTLYDIAALHGVSTNDLKSWNNMRTSRIYPGRKLVIRRASIVGGEKISTYTVRRGDTLSSIASRHGVKIDQLCAWNGISPRTTLYPGNSLQIRTAAPSAAR